MQYKPTNFAWEHTQVCSALMVDIYILLFYLQTATVRIIFKLINDIVVANSCVELSLLEIDEQN